MRWTTKWIWATVLATILLAEDYPTNQLLVIKHLHKAGYRVDLAENGEEAVTAFLEKEYDLILMDMQMPVMDGPQATKRIRAAEARRSGASGRPESRIPIVALTANAMKGYREKCLEMGMDDYLPKPFKRSQLLLAVEKWTSNRATAAVSTDSAVTQAAPADTGPADPEAGYPQSGGELFTPI